MRHLWIWIAIVIGLSIFADRLFQQSGGDTLTYSEFLTEVNQDRVVEVRFEGDGYKLTGTRADGSTFETTRPINVYDEQLIPDLDRQGVRIIGEEPETQGLWTQLLIACFPLLLMAGLLYLFMRQAQGGKGPGNPLSFGSNRAKQLKGGKVETRFSDVAGCDEAKEDVAELVDFLRDSERFRRIGGRIPRGVLLVGPPGTGKTLLARAIAGEAEVNFFTISGSDFVEMFVGVGAARVRNMFAQARQQAPCIIFIDEIDAVGRHRGAGLGGGHDEREQTLNQLLVEMDGFDESNNVIVIAATNRPDVLDPALLRPGRFDRQITVDLPDIVGRTNILEVHTRKTPLAKDVDLRIIARGTPGFSGADLANLVNEAALLAAGLNLAEITRALFHKARDKILMGAERKSMVMSEAEKKLTAYHEAGHAIIGYMEEGDHDPVHKISIIPRGRALGVTVFLPEEDRHSLSRKGLMARITSLYGGRLAEELIFGADSVTTGASNDIERATELARNMVTKWGLSQRLGPVHYEDDITDPFLGRRAAQGTRQLSSSAAETIEEEVRTIITECLNKAREVLEANMDKLHAMAKALMLYETLEREQIEDIMASKEPRAMTDTTIPSPAPPPTSKTKKGTDEDGSAPQVGPSIPQA